MTRNINPASSPAAATVGQYLADTSGATPTVGTYHPKYNWRVLKGDRIVWTDDKKEPRHLKYNSTDGGYEILPIITSSPKVEPGFRTGKSLGNRPTLMEAYYAAASDLTQEYKEPVPLPLNPKGEAAMTAAAPLTETTRSVIRQIAELHMTHGGFDYSLTAPKGEIVLSVTRAVGELHFQVRQEWLVDGRTIIKDVPKVTVTHGSSGDGADLVRNHVLRTEQNITWFITATDTDLTKWANRAFRILSRLDTPTEDE